MSRIILVDDPLYQGKPPIPQTVRAYAMRSLFAAGMPIADIAAKYGVSYHLAYKTCKASVPPATPPREATAEPAAHAPKKAGRPITTHSRAVLDTWPVDRLKKAIFTKGLDTNSAYAKDLQELLDEKSPGWWE